MLPQRRVGDAGHGLNVKAIRKRKFVQLARDRLGLQRRDIARQSQIDVGSLRVRAFGSGAIEDRGRHFRMSAENIADKRDLMIGQIRAVHSFPLSASRLRTCCRAGR